MRLRLPDWAFVPPEAFLQLFALVEDFADFLHRQDAPVSDPSDGAIGRGKAHFFSFSLRACILFCQRGGGCGDGMIGGLNRPGQAHGGRCLSLRFRFLGGGASCEGGRGKRARGSGPDGKLGGVKRGVGEGFVGRGGLRSREGFRGGEGCALGRAHSGGGGAETEARGKGVEGLVHVRLAQRFFPISFLRLRVFELNDSSPRGRRGGILGVGGESSPRGGEAGG